MKINKQTGKQKILYVITKSNFGGAQRYVYELATSFSGKYDVAVALGGNGILREKLDAAGIKTIQIHSFQRDVNILKEFSSFRELLRIYKKEKPDIVHLNSSKAGGSGALMARIAGIKKIVYTAHGWPFLEPRNILWRSLAWSASYATALLAHKIILVSQNDLLHTKMPFVQKKLATVHTAVPAINFKLPADARTVLFSEEQIKFHKSNTWLITNAELNQNKNLFTAIDAIVVHNKTHDNKIFYSIMGDGELKEELATYIQSNHAENYIILLGYIPDGRKYLKAFDMFLLPSKKEGMPYALIEAGAAGLPVIASNVGGIPEIVIHEKNGLLIDPNDTNSIVEAFDTLCKYPEKRTQYGQALRQKIVSEFTLSNMIEETASLYFG